MNLNWSVTEKQLTEWRRILHEHAESGLSEFWTTAFLAENLTNSGLSVTVGPKVMDESSIIGRASAEIQKNRLENALEQGASPEWLKKMAGITGLIVDIRPDLPQRTAFRFDIDAVDVPESADREHKPAALGFQSRNKAHMHACGHDGHAAIGLGVAFELAKNREKLKHNVRLIFEPGEEGSRGALPMIKAGVMEGIRYFMAAHIGGGATEAHSLVCGTRGFLATTKFDVEYFGLASHSGSDPHQGRNSLLAAACAVLNLHALPRHGKGDTRVTVGQLESGVGRNVIPDYARMVCETRGSSTEIDEFMFTAAKRVIKSAAEMYEQKHSLTIMGKTGCAESDPWLAGIVGEVASEIPYFEKEKIVEMGKGFGTDDACAFMAEAQKNGGLATYALIGSPLAAGHHNGKFDFDESVLLPCVKLFTLCAFRLDIA